MVRIGGVRPVDHFQTQIQQGVVKVTIRAFIDGLKRLDTKANIMLGRLRLVQEGAINRAHGLEVLRELETAVSALASHQNNDIKTAAETTLAKVREEIAALAPQAAAAPAPIAPPVDPSAVEPRPAVDHSAGTQELAVVLLNTIVTMETLQDESTPLVVLLRVRADGKIDGTTEFGAGKIKGAVQILLKRRIEDGKTSLAEIRSFLASEDARVRAGAEKALKLDQETPLPGIAEETARPPVIDEASTPEPVAAAPAVLAEEVHKPLFTLEEPAQPVVEARKPDIFDAVAGEAPAVGTGTVEYSTVATSAGPAAAEPAATPVTAEVAPAEPIAVIGLTPIDARSSLQVEIDELSATFVRLTTVISEFDAELTALTGRRNNKLMPEFNSKSRELEEKNARLAELRERTGSRTATFYDEIGRLEAQLQTERAKLVDPSGAISLEFTPEETEKMAAVDRLLKTFEDKTDDASLKMKGVIGAKKQAIEDAAKKRATDKLTAETRVEVDRLGKEIANLTERALEVELQAVAEREELPVLEGTTLPALSARIASLSEELEAARVRISELTTLLDTKRGEREQVVARAVDINAQVMNWQAKLAAIVPAAAAEEKPA